VTFTSRLVRLHVGFAVIAFGIAFNVRSRLGLGPLFIVYVGLHRHLGITIGTAGVITNAVLFASALAMRQRPGLGTLGQVVLVGPMADGALAVVPHVHSMALRATYLGGSLLVLCCGASLYLSAALGAGPYDAVMWGIFHRVHRWPLVTIRVTMECTALVTGWLLGGAVGIGTVVIGLAIGPGIAFGLRLLGALPDRAAPPPARGQPVVAPASSGR